MEILNALSGNQQQILDAAFLICFFWVALRKSEHICNSIMFKAACWVFATAFVIPNLIQLYLYNGQPLAGNPFQNRPALQSGHITELLLAFIVPALHMTSFMLAISSIIPTSTLSPHRSFEVLPPPLQQEPRR